MWLIFLRMQSAFLKGFTDKQQKPYSMPETANNEKGDNKMKYSISYEIERYEVRLIVKGSGSYLGGNNFFYCEEDAVEFAFNYVKEHPDWTFKILRVEKAIVEEV